MDASSASLETDDESYLLQKQPSLPSSHRCAPPSRFYSFGLSFAVLVAFTVLVAGLSRRQPQTFVSKSLNTESLGEVVGTCYKLGVYYEKPTMMEGQAETTPGSAAACQVRCASTAGCEHFSFWPNGACHLTATASTLKLAGENFWNVVSGPRQCNNDAVQMLVNTDYNAAFNMMDADHDGKISISEDIQYEAARGKLETIQAAADKTKMGDTDGDGALRREEFIDLMLKVNKDKAAEQGPGAMKFLSKMRNFGVGLVNQGAETFGVSATVSQERAADAGSVAGLYTFGGPATAFPGLRNPLSPDGCFPGLRVWNEAHNSDMFGNYAQKHDPIAFLAYVARFEHAFQDSLTSVVTNPTKPTLTKCGNLQSIPIADPYMVLDLHKGNAYVAGMESQKLYPLVDTMSHFATSMAYSSDRGAVREAAMKYGWNLVGAASEPKPGSTPDMSYLLQEPNSLDCTVTFEGTKDIANAVADITCARVNFCGLSDERDFQGAAFNPQPGHALVHQGFRDELLNMVKLQEFQSNIRAKLPMCNKVFVTGHSLGGAQAELFTACANRAIPEGAPGWEDYKLIGWQKGTPQKLPVLSVPRSGPSIDNEGSGKCQEYTSSTCFLGSCGDAAGPAICNVGRCKCLPNHCAVGGTCMKRR